MRKNGILILLYFAISLFAETSIGFDVGIDLSWFRSTEFAPEFLDKKSYNGLTTDVTEWNGIREVKPQITAALLLSQQFAPFFELQGEVRYLKKRPNLYSITIRQHWDPQTERLILNPFDSVRFDFGYEIQSLAVIVKPTFIKQIGRVGLNFSIGTGICIPLSLQRIETPTFIIRNDETDINEYKRINIPIMCSFGVGYSFAKNFRIIFRNEISRNLFYTRTGYESVADDYYNTTTYDDESNYSFPLKEDKLLDYRVTVGIMYTFSKHNNQ